MTHSQKINFIFCENSWIIIKHSTPLLRSRTLERFSLHFLAKNITPLDVTNKIFCEGKVSAEECLKALHDFKNEKITENRWTTSGIL